MVRAEPIRFIDDAGQALQLSTPARRLVSLSPHITELLFFVGAGSHLVGVAEHSDFPEAAKSLPRVGRYNDIDLERIVRLKPDAVIVWGRGAANPKVDRLKALGLRVIYSDPQTIAGIADNMVWMSQLTGLEGQAQGSIDAWRQRLDAVQGTGSAAALSGPEGRQDAPLVFYQVWDAPLMTVSRKHIIAQAIRLCGGRLLFGDLPLVIPTVNMESVIRGNPDVILFSGDGSRTLKWGQAWAPWKRISAVKSNHVFELPPDLLVRAGPRFLDGVEKLCHVLDRVRESR
jgi:iron complex transport system substrate-binding protein